MDIESIADYIRSGSKSSESIGVEIEHFVTDSANHAVSYYGENGVEKILLKIEYAFDKKIYSQGHLIGLSNDSFHITLEPAAQLEISIEPCSKISEIESKYNEFLKIIKPVLANYGYSLSMLGYRPLGMVDELELIPKKRYEYMDEYFKASGRYGKNMMRGTASTQVSIDFSDESDCIRKLRLANILTPIFSFICDNAPIFEGKHYGGRMLRSVIWSSVDSRRCGIIPHSMDKDFSFGKYAEYILNTPAILDEKNNCTGNKTFGELYPVMTESQIEHALSMVFPDVRLKKYIEIRPADSMPIEYVLSYAAFVKGIFLSVTAACDYFGEISEDDIEAAKNELINNGFNANIYGKRVTDILDFLTKSAEKSLNNDERKYLNKIKEIIKTKTTLKERT